MLFHVYVRESVISVFGVVRGQKASIFFFQPDTNAHVNFAGVCCVLFSLVAPRLTILSFTLSAGHEYEYYFGP